MYLINGPANSLQLLQTTEHLTTQHNAARTRLIMIHRLKVYRLMKMMARKDTWKTILILCPWFPLLSCAVCSPARKDKYYLLSFHVCSKNLDIFVKGRSPNFSKSYFLKRAIIQSQMSLITQMPWPPSVVRFGF